MDKRGSPVACRAALVGAKGMYDPQELVDLARIGNRWITKIPASRRRERNRDLGVTDAGDVISVAIDLRDEMRQRHELAAYCACRSDDAPRVRHSRQRWKPDLFNGDQRSVAEPRVLTRRRRDIGGGPFVPGAK